MHATSIWSLVPLLADGYGHPLGHALEEVGEHDLRHTLQLLVDGLLEILKGFAAKAVDLGLHVHHVA